jgi:demethoxyubiquinone hydroxylase (CLK1/Coq7/Cat5 family)
MASLNPRLAFLLCRQTHSAASVPLASAAYAKDAPLTDANTATPIDLTPKQKRILEHIVRVDQAGEL